MKIIAYSPWHFLWEAYQSCTYLCRYYHPLESSLDPFNIIYEHLQIFRKDSRREAHIYEPLSCYLSWRSANIGHLQASWINIYIYKYIIQIYSGITCGRVLNGELYTCKLYKLINLCWSTGCFVKLHFTPRDDFIDGFSTVNIQDLAGLCC